MTEPDIHTDYVGWLKKHNPAAVCRDDKLHDYGNGPGYAPLAIIDLSRAVGAHCVVCGFELFAPAETTVQHLAKHDD